MTPSVLLLIFNRPGSTQRVFEQIRRVKPNRLFVAADGPRFNRPDDKALCEESRNVIDHVEWECEIHTLFRDVNLGCKLAVSSAITWFFEHEQAGIILEDDCVPDLTFFQYCAELLKYHQADERVMAVSGNNFQDGQQRTPYSYYFSVYNHYWGWASWRRAWQYYDGTMKAWPELRETRWLSTILKSDTAATYWRSRFDKAYSGEVDSWGHPWTFSCWLQKGLTILPEQNLVTNIGFGPDGTHTKNPDSRIANLPTEAMSFPLRHPQTVSQLQEADDYTFLRVYRRPRSTLIKRAARWIYRACIRVLSYVMQHVTIQTSG